MPEPLKNRFTFELGTPEGTLRANLAIPAEPMRLADLSRLVMPLDDQIVALGVKRHLPTLGAISCKKGCDSCCYQLVPISPPEAFMIHDLVAAMPEARQEEVLTRVVDAEAALESFGLDEASFSGMANDDALRKLLIEWHHQSVACPFLENGACTAYTSRPSGCREYLVTSPAENCTKLGEAVVRRMPVSIRMSLALSRVAARLLGGEPTIFPLTLAIGWAEAHEEEGQRRFDGFMLVNMLLEELSGGNPADKPS
ncbi:YkgJ family cysteine cluster protein [Polyangium mundeleinium]|uniref:YkgJ family cysteine cluster protein n=1 Tax=Polyangium mundeleinium TaxID=2995306 RepID=A0ABT5F063_9BACT|nr:YkgJ family cysteine cluster protein [Polyangium mundeleinium]MDC0746999.1 YkgJ family cysteine cluster protein [Polyangium mundeleinium]